jgi:hypothetical protein
VLIRPHLVAGTRRWWLVAVVVLAIASASALALLGSATVMPSAFRNPLSRFVEPGVAVWWLVLGGPFRSVPSSASGIALAAAANAALWSLVLWFVVAVVRAVRHLTKSRGAGS